MLPIHAPKSLIRDLACCDKKATVPEIAGLLTVPEFSGNTLRIELLVHLACVFCNGAGAANHKKLMKWLNKDLAKTMAIRFEDPVEDVFIGNVMTEVGNTRIFDGLWEGSDFYLQQVLDAAFFMSGAPPRSGNIRKEIISLLRLSDVVADRCSLKPLHKGGGTPQGSVEIGSNKAVDSWAKTVSFASEELRDLRIDPVVLSPFISSEQDTENLKNETIGNSSLERHPLLRFQDHFVVALPSAISAALRLYLLEWFCSKRLVQNFSMLLRLRQGDLVFNDLLSLLDTQTRVIEDLPQKPECLSNIDDVVCEFDVDKLAHVVLIHDDL